MKPKRMTYEAAKKELAKAAPNGSCKFRPKSQAKANQIVQVHHEIEAVLNDLHSRGDLSVEGYRSALKAFKEAGL